MNPRSPAGYAEAGFSERSGMSRSATRTFHVDDVNYSETDGVVTITRQPPPRWELVIFKLAVATAIGFLAYLLRMAVIRLFPWEMLWYFGIGIVVLGLWGGHIRNRIRGRHPANGLILDRGRNEVWYHAELAGTIDEIDRIEVAQRGSGENAYYVVLLVMAGLAKPGRRHASIDSMFDDEYEVGLFDLDTDASEFAEPVADFLGVRLVDLT